MRKAIAIDFDGCLCTDVYPEIGEPNWPVIRRALAEQKVGAGLILWTCREGNLLREAVTACEGWGLTFDAVNESLPDWIEAFKTQPRKVGASEYWDDKAVNPITLHGTYVSVEWFNKVKAELDACKAELQKKGSCETCIRYESRRQCPMFYGEDAETCLRERLCGYYDCQDGSNWIWRGGGANGDHKGLLEYLHKIGFRKFLVGELITEDWGVVTVTATGFGRFRRPKEKELAEIRAGKPAFPRLILSRTIFGFRLWKIEV